MRNLILICCIIAAYSTSTLGGALLPKVVSTTDNDKKVVTTIYTFYGNADITFYPSGQPKRIRCRAPKDTVCLTLTDEGVSPNTLHTYSGGTLSGTYTSMGSGTHTVEFGDDVLEW